MPHVHGHHHHSHHHDNDQDNAECVANLCLLSCLCAQAICECMQNSENNNPTYVSSAPSLDEIREREQARLKHQQVQAKKVEVDQLIQLLDNELKNSTLLTDKIRVAGQEVVKEAQSLITSLTDLEELGLLSGSLRAAIDVAKHPHDRQKLECLYKNSQQTIGKVSTLGRFLGALAFFVGAIAIGLSVLIFKEFLGWGPFAGGGLTAVGLFGVPIGLGFFCGSKQGSLSKTLDQFEQSFHEEDRTRTLSCC